ncbi:NAD-dependent epimerase/dehydratase family protein [Agromyces bauzanensis]|uniref:NAD-dependent epimerase n=1 Tax=Agromyces bauzanensis TaxID=1308924 RepID=A0A917PHR6_9MICO|nr:NAD-dependent epimerase/dehydratase family protein [Agromyces bauzanensis]GGJ79019.1 NAD-dependent epimerase [Agromyces bauzanensis]
MSRHLVIGAGPTGSSLAEHLVASGQTVRVVTRSGRMSTAGAESVALDATDPEALARAADGVDVMYDCANPGPYPRWETGWPPLAAAALSAAERTGAVLVTMGNLYGYGPVDQPMTPALPLAATSRTGRLRARLWLDALAAHEAGRVRTTEVRASDYLGPTVRAEHGLIARYGASVLAGRAASVVGDPDAPHSWTYVPDIGHTLEVLGRDERAWGRAWHVPTNPPVAIRALLEQLSTAAGVASPVVRRMPRAPLTALAPFVPLLGHVRELRYQFDRPFVIDAAETTEAFGIRPTPWAEVIDRTAAAWAAR